MRGGREGRGRSEDPHVHAALVNAQVWVAG